jgi:nucleotide-binding universal stress UspA family protein
LTVLPPDPTAAQRVHAERFLEAGVRTLAPMGVPAEIRVAAGDFETEVLASFGDEHDLLAVGAPLPGPEGTIHLGSPLRRLLSRTGRRPVLVVRGSAEIP